jgi:hypothetical protein
MSRVQSQYNKIRARGSQFRVQGLQRRQRDFFWGEKKSKSMEKKKVIMYVNHKQRFADKEIFIILLILFYPHVGRFHILCSLLAHDISLAVSQI